MKEIALGLLAFGVIMMAVDVVVAMGAYGHSNAVIQWIHHPFATAVFGVGLLAVFLGTLGWMDVENGRN